MVFHCFKDYYTLSLKIKFGNLCINYVNQKVKITMRNQGVGRKRKKTTPGVVKTLRDRLDGITGSENKGDKREGHGAKLLQVKYPCKVR